MVNYRSQSSEARAQECKVNSVSTSSFWLTQVRSTHFARTEANRHCLGAVHAKDVASVDTGKAISLRAGKTRKISHEFSGFTKKSAGRYPH